MKKLTLILVLGVMIMMMVVPVASAAAPDASSGYWYTVQRGDTLYSISMRTGVNIATLKAYNHIPNANHIYAGQSLWIPGHPGNHPPQHKPPMGKYYTVHPGDTLYGIGMMYGCSAHYIAKANGIHNINHSKHIYLTEQEVQ